MLLSSDGALAYALNLQPRIVVMRVETVQEMKKALPEFQPTAVIVDARPVKINRAPTLPLRKLPCVVLASALPLGWTHKQWVDSGPRHITRRLLDTIQPAMIFRGEKKSAAAVLNVAR